MPACFGTCVLQEYVDGQLEAVRLLQVETHLAECHECRRLVAQLRAVTEPLRQTAAVSPPVELPERILAAVAGLRPLPSLTCDEALARLSERMDGRLDHRAAQEVEAHLAACNACHRTARQMGAMIEALRTVEPEPVPAGLLAGTMAAVEAQVPRRVARPVRVWQRWATGAVGLAAAAAVLLAVALHTPALVRNAAGPRVALAPLTAPGPSATSRTPSTTSTGRQPVTVPVRGSELTVSGQAPVAARERPLTAAAAPATGGSGPRVAALPLPAPAGPAVAIMDLPGVRDASPVALAARRVSPGEAVVPIRVAAPPDLDSRAVAAAPIHQPSDHPASSQVMVASLPTVKAAPADEMLPSASDGATEKRTSWVSRPPAEKEAEVATPPAERSQRLAMAKAAINHSAFRTGPGHTDDWGVQ
jgi:anti-sigma factor RsiW